MHKLNKFRDMLNIREKMKGGYSSVIVAIGSELIL